ncbi:MAG: Helix-turn-helix domain protein [Pelotomaculum sp. PtaU1.Bin035]|nr:MAG: Helix-turn-helix domain protein [Pelotomaculum sp. PtaU1.Bin035]
MENELLTKEELSRFLKISIPTIDRWRQEGMPCKKMGRLVRFEKKRVLEWIKENKN